MEVMRSSLVGVHDPELHGQTLSASRSPPDRITAGEPAINQEPRFSLAVKAGGGFHWRRPTSPSRRSTAEIWPRSGRGDNEAWASQTCRRAPAHLEEKIISI